MKNNLESIPLVYNLFFEPGEVVEIRALGLAGKYPAWEGWAGNDGVVSGYFNDTEAIENAAKALEDAGAVGV